jgi:sterol 3beta-glucosyltransferase
MRILLLTLGTRGDVQPFVALGRGLKQNGHHVTVCTNSSFAPLVKQYDLEYAYMNDDFVELAKGHTGRRAMEEWGSASGKVRWMVEAARLFKPIFRKTLAEEWAAARDAELVIYHPQAVGGYHIAEALGIPGIMADPLPTWIPTGEFPNFTFPDLKLGRWFNRATYRLLPVLTAVMFGSVVKKWREEILKMAPRSRFKREFVRSDGRPVPVLCAFSRHVLPPPADWPVNVHVTGYWFLNEARGWQPPPDLAEFIEDGPAPVFVGFGSMSGSDPGKTTRMVLQALAESGQRGLLGAGWGGLEVDRLPETALKIGSVPFDWLFLRVSAVVHHGGAGTTAAGLLAGRPTVICPFVADQPFWGRRVSTLGVGPPPIPQRKLTAHNLASAIKRTVTDAGMKQRAAELQKKILAEDGIGNAVKLVENYAGISQTG